TINTINGLLLTLGDGIPNPGDVLKTGSTLFKQIESKLDDTFPGLDWVGDAAEKYSAQNLAQKLRMQAMGNLDQLTGGFVSNQAKYISDARSTLRTVKGWAEDVKRACEKVEQVWLIGEAISWAMAIPSCAFFMIVVGGQMLVLTIQTLNNTTNLKG